MRTTFSYLKEVEDNRVCFTNFSPGIILGDGVNYAEFKNNMRYTTVNTESTIYVQFFFPCFRFASFFIIILSLLPPSHAVNLRSGNFITEIFNQLDILCMEIYLIQFF